MISLSSEFTTSYTEALRFPRWVLHYGLTLTIMTSVDLKSVGFAAGSSIMADDWKDWNKPVMSLDIAKLFRNST